jgi:signal transduction histidine kinase
MGVRHLHELLLNAPLMITVHRGREGRLELLNVSAWQAVGERDLTGKTLAEVFPQLERCQGESSPHVGVNEPLSLDWTGKGAAETRRITFVRQPMVGKDGRVEGSVMLAIDVTSQLTGEVLATPEGTWVHAALDQVGTPLVLADPRTLRIWFANAAARSLPHPKVPSGSMFGSAVGLETGYFCTDASGAPIAPEDLPAARAARGEIIDGMELCWHTPQGIQHLVCFAENVEACEGHPPLIVLSFFEMTSLRAIEEKLAESTAARDEFLALISHELRTPLTALKLQAQSLLKRCPQVTGLAAVERATRRMEELIDQIVEAERVRAAGVPVQPQDLDACAVVDGVIDRLAPDTRRAGSTLTRVGASALQGRWDRRLLEQVVLHLVRNAIRFGAGTPVHCECRDCGPTISVAVSDKGIGVDPADQERIFERFGRAVSARHYGGLGLGLWATREIVQRMGGSVSVKSAVGQGATFTVDLPKSPPTSSARTSPC